MVFSIGQYYRHSQILERSLVIVGYENRWFCGKGIPVPRLLFTTPTPESGSHQTQAGKVITGQKTRIFMKEMAIGCVDSDLIARIGDPKNPFDATVYEGRPDGFLKAYPIRGCHIDIDRIDNDSADRQAPLALRGILFFSYFGEVIEP